MTDQEKVITRLEECFSASCRGFRTCPYSDNDGWDAVEAALALLREQEPVKPKTSEWLEDSDPGQEYGTTWACRKCGYSIHKPSVWNPYEFGYKYCLHCGRKMEANLDAETST